jgi:XTP/dITP diphosphohydrolase
MSDKPGITAGPAFERLAAIVSELRIECPWDRNQKLADTPRHILEEAYEAADAVANGDRAQMLDEVGDLIVQAMFAATIASETGGASIEEILTHAADKLVGRHPHVYGDVRAESVDAVLKNWDAIKAKEKNSRADANPLAQTTRALPALMRAEKLGEKSRRLGMDWASLSEVLAKAREELDEIDAALERGDLDGAAEEIGDLMLAVANAPRFVGRDAESTLRRACEKFIARFGQLAEIASARGVELAELDAAEIDALWTEAKKLRR